jgi:hypothetical protein
MARRYKRVMAVGCSHGEKFRPEVRFELGDLIDTACFRTGATGTKDESHSSKEDHARAVSWIREYEPTHIAWGNHDWRLYDMMTHPKAIVSDLASQLWTSLELEAEKVRAKTVPYDIEDGWHYLGGRAWGHGYMYNSFAVRDHAEMLGMPVVMAHLHAPQQIRGRTINNTESFCVGAMADDRKLTYGRRRRNSLTHGHGLVYGELSETESHLWLIHAENGKPFRFPPNVL